MRMNNKHHESPSIVKITTTIRMDLTCIQLKYLYIGTGSRTTFLFLQRQISQRARELGFTPNETVRSCYQNFHTDESHTWFLPFKIAGIVAGLSQR